MPAFSTAVLQTLRALAATFVPAADAERVASIASDALVRAVDPAQLGQLRLVPGLYVADASTFPAGIGVNPMITAMAIAKRVARTVLAEEPRA